MPRGSCAHSMVLGEWVHSVPVQIISLSVAGESLTQIDVGSDTIVYRWCGFAWDTLHWWQMLWAWSACRACRIYGQGCRVYAVQE
jgi:hypothetical protein